MESTHKKVSDNRDLDYLSDLCSKQNDILKQKVEEMRHEKVELVNDIIVLSATLEALKKKP